MNLDDERHSSGSQMIGKDGHEFSRRVRTPFLIGIAGGTGAGKTTCARRLAKMLATGQTVSLLEFDSYYKEMSLMPVEQRERENFDHPDAMDLDRFREDLYRLKQGETIIKPVFDLRTDSRHAGGALLVAAAIVIAEGSMLLVDEEVGNLFDIKIFVDTPPNIRLRRRLERDVRERARSLTGAIDHYTMNVLPLHDQFIEPTRRLAHFVISGWEDSGVSLAEIASFVHREVQVGADMPLSSLPRHGNEPQSFSVEGNREG